MHHVFVTEVADEYGIAAAVILNNIFYWVRQNEANEVNYHDGYYWTYNSKKGFSRIFTYLSEKQIRNALDCLRNNGLILTGNYNKNPYDRTLWYTVTKKGVAYFQNGVALEARSISPEGLMDKPEWADVKAREGSPIPYINNNINITDNNTDVNSVDGGGAPSRTRTAKETYGEYKHVRLTRNEMDRLVNDYGSKEVSKAIKLLDEYIEEKGYKSKSHNLALRRWVFDAVQEREKKQGRKPSQTGYDWDNL